MTEEQLYAYRRCENKMQRLMLEFKKCTILLSSAKSQNFKSIPGSGNEDKLCELLDRRDDICNRMLKCRAMQAEEEKRLDEASEHLADKTLIDVFDKLYRDGLDITETAKAMNYSPGSIYRYRKIILDKLKDF